MARALALLLRHEPETAFQPWLRALAALLAVAAGAVHLAQVGVHIQEGWPIAAFFLVLGVVQVVGGALLLKPLRQPWLWIGVAGSAAVIGLWVISRTVGVPFVGHGQPEPVGVADAIASLAETWTIILLAFYVAEPIRRWRRAIVGFGAGLAASLAVIWVMAAGRGIFDDDPARFRAALPPLIDWLVAASAVALAGGLFIGALAPLKVPWVRGLMRGLVGAVALVAFAQVWLTLPPTIGQNLDCRYAPLSTVLAGSHVGREPVVIGDGEQWILPIFEVHVCESAGDLALGRVEPTTVIGDGATVNGFWLLPVGVHVAEGAKRYCPTERRPSRLATTSLRARRSSLWCAWSGRVPAPISLAQYGSTTEPQRPAPSPSPPKLQSAAERAAEVARYVVIHRNSFLSRRAAAPDGVGPRMRHDRV